MSEDNSQATFCATLVDEWVRAGLRHVVCCPGSRSTPMVLAVASRNELQLHMRLDERSAGFVALGLTRALGQVVPIIVTSGTAATELHAAVAEADLSGIPLLVVTADRPPELIGSGAPQTIVQRDLFGPMVRASLDPGVPFSGAAGTWRSLACRALEAARGANGTPGPVQLNLAFRDPLDGRPGELPVARKGAWTTAVPALEDSFAVGERTDTWESVLVIAGAGAPSGLAEIAATHSWALLGDPRSGLRSTNDVVTLADPILRADGAERALKPDAVLLIGEPWASKVLATAVARWSSEGAEILHLSDRQQIQDPNHIVNQQFVGSSATLRATLHALPSSSTPTYRDLWRNCEAVAASALDTALERVDALSEPGIAKFLGTVAGIDTLTISSSMPIREFEWFAKNVLAKNVVANRGVNGIDGVVSSAIGAALAGGSGLCVVGDLAFLHDLSALVDGLGSVPGSLTVVVVDNGGGGIFSFLPQASSVEPANFERLFTTTRPVDQKLMLEGLGYDATVVTTHEEFAKALEATVGSIGLSFIVAKVGPPPTNVALHEVLNGAIASAVSPIFS
ncbi:MAG: 2-succinyl-5-enolpyruvyl-6-hydroxy-3-cyclohexene-1-carboxylic-acid synthase [Actinomycetota bacterium]